MGCSLSSRPHSASSVTSFRTMSATRSNQSTSSSLASKIIYLDTGSLEILDLERMRALLTEYMATEDRIQDLESTNPMTVFYVKKSQLDQIEAKVKDQFEAIEALREILYSQQRSLKASSGRRRPVCPSVLSVLETQGDKGFNREDQNVLTTINALEIATTELEMLYQERALHGNELTALYDTLNQLSDEYKKQDVILERLGIDNGFNEDSKEESDLVELESRRVSISETYERWKEARTLLIQIAGQFSIVLTNMDEAGEHPSEDIPVVSYNSRGHYEIGEELRDRLVSIGQGLNNVKFLLRLDLPYCTETEMAVLRKAMKYLFIDLRTEDRRQHAKECYAAFQQRTIALLMWVDMTAGSVIEPALELKTAQIQDKVRVLSEARLQKICKQFPDLYGKKRHTLSPMTVHQPRLPYTSTLVTHLDPTSSAVLQSLDVTLLAQVASPAQLFDTVDNRLGEAVDTRFVQPVVNVKERTKRFTRKASMTNLTQMLVNIN